MIAVLIALNFCVTAEIKEAYKHIYIGHSSNVSFKIFLILLLVNNFQEIVALHYFNGAVDEILCFTDIINDVWSSVMSCAFYILSIKAS